MSKNIRHFIFIFAALLSLPSISSAQEKPAAKPAKAPLTFNAFKTKGMEVIKGTFPIYRKANKTYIEISTDLLGKDILSSGIITKGSWVGTASSITDLISFSLGNKNSLDIRKIACPGLADDNLSQANEASDMQPVLYNYPIAAYGKDKESYIIDITKDVESTGKLFAFPNLQWVNRPVKERSGLDSIYVINNGVKFSCMHTQTDYMPALSLGGMGYDKHISVLIDWTLQVLPERKVALRKADKRIGYSTVAINDFRSDPTKITSVNFIRRWSLKPKDKDMKNYKAGKLVEPENPIKIYLDSTLNHSMRAAAIRGIDEWNKCLEQAGFRNALVVCEGMPESHFAYHQIIISYELVLGRQQTVTDPRTGEILCCVAAISGKEVEDTEKEIQLRIGAYDTKLFNAHKQIVREELYRYLTSRLMGNTLGLLNNYQGSMAYTVAQLRNPQWVTEHGISASVTDGIAYNYFVQPGDNIPLRDLFSKAGDYDRWAIEWGYRLYPDCDKQQEKDALNLLASKAAINPVLRCTPSSNYDYRVMKSDLSSDKLQAAELGMKNLERLLPQLEGIVNSMDDEDAWYDYWEYAPNLYANYTQYVFQALDYVGSFAKQPIIRGYNEKPYFVASKAEQERAMQFIVKHVLQGKPAWMRNNTMRKIAGYTGDEGMQTLVTTVAGRLASEDLMARMMESQTRFGSEAYTLDDMNKVLDKSVFLSFSATQPVNKLVAEAQLAFVKQYVKSFCKARDSKKSDAIALYVAARMEKISKNISRLASTHAVAATRNHYRGLEVFINRNMAQKPEAAKAVKK